MVGSVLGYAAVSRVRFEYSRRVRLGRAARVHPDARPAADAVGPAAGVQPPAFCRCCPRSSPGPGTASASLHVVQRLVVRGRPRALVVLALAPEHGVAVGLGASTCAAFAAEVAVRHRRRADPRDLRTRPPLDRVPAVLARHRPGRRDPDAGRVRASRWRHVRGRCVLLAIGPLVWLLRVFSQDRHERYSTTLELNRAYRGTVMLLADVVESDDGYTGEHSRSVVELVQAVTDHLHVDPGNASGDGVRRAAARRRQDLDPQGDPEQARQADGGGVRADEDPHGRGPVPAGPRGRPARPHRRGRALVPRALGRQGLPGRPEG